MTLRTLSPKVVAFLDAPRHAVIATHDADGKIWQAVVWYALTDDGILMNSLHGRHWSANLQRDTRLSMTVVEGEEYVILRGRAVVIDDPERGLAEARELALRYGGDPSVHDGQHRVRVLFQPDTVGLHGELAAGVR
jgi:PPOX class probable F420-dependent enzyme